MSYKELIALGFKRFEHSDGFDELGFYDFLLELKVSNEITFEWHWQTPHLVKMVKYKKHDVENYLNILDSETLKALINLYTIKCGNKEPKESIGKDLSIRKQTYAA